MKRQLLFIGLLIAILGAGAKLGPGFAIQTILVAGGEVDAATAQQVLAATVQIVLLAPMRDAQGQPVVYDNGNVRDVHYQVGEGFGTMVRQGDEVLIITHDHWTLLHSQLAKARFYSAGNVLLAEVSGPEFLNLIRYRDGGTLVLAAPVELLQSGALTPAETGSSQRAGWGTMLTVVYRQPGTGALSVQTMAVTSTADFQGRSSFLLRGPEGRTVVAGNSGGGIWQNGRLIGNMWTTVQYENLDTGDIRLTSESRAAQLAVASW